MDKRQTKIEQAKAMLIPKLYNSIRKQWNSKIELETCLTVNTNILYVGAEDRYLVKHFDNQKLEDMLNILQQCDCISWYERVCGPAVFKIGILNYPPVDSNVFYINTTIPRLKIA